MNFDALLNSLNHHTRESISVMEQMHRMWRRRQLVLIALSGANLIVLAVILWSMAK